MYANNITQLINVWDQLLAGYTPGLEPFTHVTIKCTKYILVFLQIRICLFVTMIYKIFKHRVR